MEEGIQDDAVDPLGQHSSVNLAYKQALLLALLDPYRLMQGEVNKVLEYLSSFGGHAHLQPLMQTSNPSGYFLARLDSDKPPRALAHDTTVTDARTDILLNTIDLARLLHQQIKQMESGADPKTLHLPVATNDFGYPNLLRRMRVDCMHCLRAWDSSEVISRFPRIITSIAYLYPCILP